MATIASIQSGNWSDPATWDGGILPAAVDTAQAITGHTVTIDQDIEVETLTHTGTGKFVLTGSTARVITCTDSMQLAPTATSSLLEIDDSYSAMGSVLNVDKVIVGAHTGAVADAVIYEKTGASGSVTINSSEWTGDSSTAGGSPSALYTEGGTNFDIYVTTKFEHYSSVAGSHPALLAIGGSGDITLTTPNIKGRYAVRTFTTATSNVVLNADITGGGSTLGSYYIYLTAPNASVTINGNVTSLSGNGTMTNAGVVRSDSGNLTINGDITGANYMGAVLVSGSGGGAISVNGDVYGGDITANGQTALAISRSGANVTIVGDIYATNPGTFTPASTVGIGVASTVDFAGNIYSSASDKANTVFASAPPVRILPTNGPHKFFSTPYSQAISANTIIAAGAELTLEYGMYSPGGDFIALIDPVTNADSGVSAEDVLLGVTYDSDDKVGTLELPDPSDVLAGVPVNGGVGTASIKMTDAAAITGSQISSLSA